MGLNQSEDRFNGVIASLAIKAPCKTVTDGVGNILLEGEQTINSIAVVVDDRVLVMEQTDPVENGIYNVRTSTWDRAADWDGNRDVVKGTLVTVNRPTNNLTSYVQVNLGVGQDEPTIDVDPVNFSIYFTQTSSLDDLDDVDLTGCADDDMMHFVGGVLVCTLGQLTFDGATLATTGRIEAAETIGVVGFGNEAAQLRDIAAADLVPSVNPRRNDQWTGVGGAFGNLDFLHDNNATSSFLGLRLRKQADLFSTRSWNVEGIGASTTQTQGQAPVKSTLVRVTSVANDNDVITLREPELGMDQIIMNLGANILQIFPESGDDLGVGTDASMTIQSGGSVWFVGIDADTWHIMSVADGSAGIIGALRGCRAYSTVRIEAPNNTAPDFDAFDVPEEEAVPLNAESFDTDSIHDNSTNNTRLQVPSGVTQVRLTAGYTQEGPEIGGLHHLRIRKNGSYAGIDASHGDMVPHMTIGAGGSGSDKGMHMLDGGIINCTDSDYFEIYILGQNNNTDTVPDTIWFMMEVIK